MAGVAAASSGAGAAGGSSAARAAADHPNALHSRLERARGIDCRQGRCARRSLRRQPLRPLRRPSSCCGNACSCVPHSHARIYSPDSHCKSTCSCHGSRWRGPRTPCTGISDDCAHIVSHVFSCVPASAGAAASCLASPPSRQRRRGETSRRQHSPRAREQSRSAPKPNQMPNFDSALPPLNRLFNSGARP